MIPLVNRRTDLHPSSQEFTRLLCRAGEATNRARAAGRQLRRIRQNAMISPTLLERLLNVQPGQVSTWESGKTILTEAWARMAVQAICAYLENPKGTPNAD